MNILVIGSGGREHALAWSIAASPLVDRLYCAPGNAGIADEAECVAIAASDTKGIVAFCRRAAIDFVVVGPEAPLVGGLVDALEGEGIAAFGPSAAAAALEGSKGFMKDLCARENIPTARYRRFRDAAAAKRFLRKAIDASGDGMPRVMNVDKNPAYPAAVEALKAEGAIPHRVALRQCRYLNNVIEQDHRTVKKRVWLAKGYGSFQSAWRTLQGIETVQMIRKGRVRWLAKGDVVDQALFIGELFGLAA